MRLARGPSAGSCSNRKTHRRTIVKLQADGSTRRPREHRQSEHSSWASRIICVDCALPGLHFSIRPDSSLQSLPSITQRLRKKMRKVLSSLLICATGLALTPAPADISLRGFFPQSVQAERDLEARFKTMPDPGRMREAMRRLSARPHHVGSPYDKDNAEWILRQFKSYGWDAHIEKFAALFPTPLGRRWEPVSPTAY